MTSPNEYLAELTRELPGMTVEELRQRRQLEETRLMLRATFDTRPLTAVKAALAALSGGDEES